MGHPVQDESIDDINLHMQHEFNKLKRENAVLSNVIYETMSHVRKIASLIMEAASLLENNNDNHK